MGDRNNLNKYKHILERSRSNALLSSPSMVGLLAIIDEMVETAFMNSIGDGERLNERFNFWKAGEARVGGLGNKWSGRPVTWK